MIVSAKNSIVEVDSKSDFINGMDLWNVMSNFQNGSHLQNKKTSPKDLGTNTLQCLSQSNGQ